jgi:hypothetical protein
MLKYGLSDFYLDWELLIVFRLKTGQVFKGVFAGVLSYHYSVSSDFKELKR